MEADVQNINNAALEVVKFAALAGFLAAATFLINLNYKAFDSVFREKTKVVWLLFFVMATIPLGLILLIFTFLFER